MPSILAAQIIVILAGFSTLSFMPPAQGKILLIPLGDYAAAHLVRLAIDHGARLVGSGDLPGSMIIYAERRRVLQSMLQAGIVPLAAPASGCGDEPTATRRHKS